MPIKVLMLVPSLRSSSGVASYAMNYFRLLERSKIQMDFVLYSDLESPYYKEIEKAGSKYYILPSIRNPIAHVQACDNILSEGDYDIIHDNTLLLSIPIMRSAKKHGVTVRILHSHSAGLGETPRKAKRNKLFLPLLKSLATDYAACSDVAAKALFGNKDYVFIPNIVSEDNLSLSHEKRFETRKKMGVETKNVIGTVGRMSPPKNPFFALEIINCLIKKQQSIEYWWIGSGSLDDAFKKRISEMELDDYVRFLGSREDVPDMYQAMDVFLLTSRFEGMPITGIEAQAMGLPCVISDTVTKDMVYTDLVRFMPLHKKADEWAEAILDAAKMKHERHSYILNLQNSPFSEKEAGKKLEEFYKERKSTNQRKGKK